MSLHLNQPVLLSLLSLHLWGFFLAYIKMAILQNCTDECVKASLKISNMSQLCINIVASNNVTQSMTCIKMHLLNDHAFPMHFTTKSFKDSLVLFLVFFFSTQKSQNRKQSNRIGSHTNLAHIFYFFLLRHRLLFASKVLFFRFQFQIHFAHLFVIVTLFLFSFNVNVLFALFYFVML